MKNTEYTTPSMTVSEHVPTMVIAMSWSDEGTDEVLTNERINANSTNWEEDFWSSRE